MFLPKGSGTLRAIYMTLRVIKEYERNKKEYNGKPNPRKEWAHYLIGTGSYEATLIAELVEAGNGFTAVTRRVNEYRVNHLKVVHVGRSCVYSTSLWLKPVVSVIKKRQQGSLNLESDWCKASHRWALQQCLMLGVLKEDAVPQKFYVDGKIPKCFSIKELPKRDIRALAVWDETHKEQQELEGTLRNGTSVEFRFPWNEDGELDLENGKFRDPGTQLNMKYRDQARFSLGMRCLTDKDGNLVRDSKNRPLGKMLKAFEYSKQKIVSHSEWMKEWRRVIKEPKGYKPEKPWMTTDREEGKFYQGDPVETLPKIGEKALQWLTAKERKPFAVITVEQFYLFFQGHPNRRKAFVKAVRNMSAEIQLKAEAAAEKALPGTPKLVNHRQHNNPWCSLHGANWNDYVLRHKDLKKIVEVRVLVKFMDDETLADFKGSYYEAQAGWVRDALTFMTAEENLKWMKREGMLHRWVLPEHDLNVMFKAYKHPRPVGNHAGGNSWDQSMNKDSDDVMLYHVAATSHLPKTDERKFSLSTPNTTSYGYRRIFNNPPVLRDEKPIIPEGECGLPAHRIAHDILALPECWKRVFLNEGLNVQTNVKGHRGDEPRQAAKDGLIQSKRGGARTKMTLEEAMDLNKWMHPDAQSAYDEFFKTPHDKWMEALGKTKEKHSAGLTDPKEATQDPDAYEIETAEANKAPAVESDDDDSVSSERSPE